MKMKAADGKMRETDVANTEQLLRLIQSIPSPKAEPFKMWLAEVGKERIDGTIDPELTIERALEQRTGQSVITPKNALDFNNLLDSVIEELNLSEGSDDDKK